MIRFIIIIILLSDDSTKTPHDGASSLGLEARRYWSGVSTIDKSDTNSLYVVLKYISRKYKSLNSETKLHQCSFKGIRL